MARNNEFYFGKLLIVDGAFSEAEGAAALETLGISGLTEEELAVLQNNVRTAVAEYNAEQQAADDAADAAAEAIESAPAADNNELVDPVFEDQEEAATGSSAASGKCYKQYEHKS